MEIANSMQDIYEFFNSINLYFDNEILPRTTYLPQHPLAQGSSEPFQKSVFCYQVHEDDINMLNMFPIGKMKAILDTLTSYDLSQYGEMRLHVSLGLDLNYFKVQN